MSESAEIRSVATRKPNWPEIVIAVGVLVAFCYFAEWELAVVLVSMLLAYILTPVVDLLSWAKVPSGVGSAIAVLLLVGAGYGVAYFSYNQASSFVDNLPKYSKEIGSVVRPFRQRAETFQHNTESALRGTEFPATPPVNTVQIRTESSWTDQLPHEVGSFSREVLALSFIPFLVYFMLTWGHHARAATVMLFSMKNRHAAYTTLGLISSMIRSFILGNFLVGLFISAVSTLVFAMLHVPFFYVVGVISGFLSLVPYLGLLLAMIAPVTVSLGQLSSSGLLAAVLAVAVLHLLGINVLYPKFLGSRLRLNPLAVTVALLFWGWLWGAMGLVLAIPITAAMKIIFDHVEALQPYGNWLGE